MFTLGALIHETTETAGTGSYVLAGAVSGRRGFVDGLGDGNSTFYSATDGAEWEFGVGTATAGADDTLSRDTVIASSNGGAAVDWGSNVKNIICGLSPLHIAGLVDPSAAAGILVRTAAAGSGNSFAARALTAVLPLSVADGDGVAGNPQIQLTLGDGLDDSDDVLEVDIDGLAAAASLDPANDYAMIWDASAAALRKVAVQALGVPSGAMLDYAGAGAAPSGFLLCDGSNVSRTTYADLFTAIGTTWGAGDGSTTFTLPDSRRRVTVGSGGTGSAELGNAVGDTGGEEEHALTEGELPSVTGAINSNMSGGGGAGIFAAGSGALTGSSPTTGAGGGSGGTSNVTLNLSFGSDEAHNNMQPSIVVQKIIKT